MTPPTDTGPAPPADDSGGHRRTDEARRRIGSARDWFQRSWAGGVIKLLQRIDLAGWTSIFGAELLWSMLPLLILLSSLADQRIDDDLSRNIGLNNHGAHIVATLFRSTPSHAFIPIATGLLFSLAGTISLVRSIQVLYERVFDQEQRGWRDAPRWILWLVVLLGVLIIEAVIGRPVRVATGLVGLGLVRLALTTTFFLWTMHFLLAGRMPWRVLVRPAAVTAVLWLGLAVFSSLYFSSVVISDSKEYGTIGVVFTLLTWFFLVGGVIAVGAALGAAWQERSGGG